MGKTYSKNNIMTALMNKENGLVDMLDLSRELEIFAPQLAEAFEEAAQGKIKKLKKVASNMELYRVVKMFAAAMKAGDIRLMEYYGGIIRDQYTDKPKVALEHSAGEGMQGVVILPKADKGE